jgi:PhnB protein
MKIRSALLTLLVFAPLACGGSPKADTAAPEPTPAPAPAPVAKAVKPIPDGYFAITPQLTVKGVDQAVEFYVKALGAKKAFSMPGPDGKTMHAEVKIGDSIIFIDEEMEGSKSPLTLGGTPATLMVYSADVNALHAAAVAAGAKPEMPLEDQFWGDRWGTVVDPFGHRWALSQHIEDLTPEQTAQRAALMYGPPPAPGAKKAKKPAKPKAAKPGDPPAWKSIAGTPAKQATPPGFHTVTLGITVANAAELIEFYKQAFGAMEIERMPSPDGKVMHATLEFGDSRLMLSDEFPEMGGKSATTLGGSPIAIHYYNTDTDATFAKVTAAGAKTLMPVGDMFWGDRYGAAIDPAGFMWGVATHKEDLTPEQMAERMKTQMAQQPKPTT